MRILEVIGISVLILLTVSGCFLLDPLIPISDEKWFAEGDTIGNKGWDFEAGKIKVSDEFVDLRLTKVNGKWYFEVADPSKQFIRDTGMMQIRDYYWKSINDLENMNDGTERLEPIKSHLYVLKTVEGNFAIVKIYDVKDDPVVIFRYAMKYRKED
ncbi:MAG: hypothetical protein J7L28_03190 [Thermotogae bacterium]|nr:hypothetical protein [Thermotogota bacterium]RKX52853.1 MAG: hypothetical protein DRP30_05520 [Thermotoga sp.]